MAWELGDHNRIVKTAAFTIIEPITLLDGLNFNCLYARRSCATFCGMDLQSLLNGLLMYACFLPVLTFHEFAHAWVASKRGDDTARNQGRVSLNPGVHIDMVGTIVLPLLSIFLTSIGSGLAGFIIGWGKPVPVNINNLRQPRLDDSLIAMAGPAMNVLLAIGLLAVAKIGIIAEIPLITQSAVQIAFISLFLCFFNLLPIPPLDGSHVVAHLLRLKWETYFKMMPYGFIMVLIAWQIDAVRTVVSVATATTFSLIAALFQLT